MCNKEHHSIDEFNEIMRLTDKFWSQSKKKLYIKSISCHRQATCSQRHSMLIERFNGWIFDKTHTL